MKKLQVMLTSATLTYSLTCVHHVAEQDYSCNSLPPARCVITHDMFTFIIYSYATIIIQQETMNTTISNQNFSKFTKR